MSVLFGIDVGTSAVKGLAIDPDGGVLARAEAEYPLSRHHARHREEYRALYATRFGR